MLTVTPRGPVFRNGQKLFKICRAQRCARADCDHACAGAGMHCGRPACISLLARAWFGLRHHHPSSLARFRLFACSSRARFGYFCLRSIVYCVLVFAWIHLRRAGARVCGRDRAWVCFVRCVCALSCRRSRDLFVKSRGRARVRACFFACWRARYFCVSVRVHVVSHARALSRARDLLLQYGFRGGLLRSWSCSCTRSLVCACVFSPFSHFLSRVFL